MYKHVHKRDACPVDAQDRGAGSCSRPGSTRDRRLVAVLVVGATPLFLGAASPNAKADLTDLGLFPLCAPSRAETGDPLGAASGAGSRRVQYAQASGTGGFADDGRPHPGSPQTAWTGLISPTDPYSDGPGKGAWVTKAGLPTARSEVAVAEAGGRVYVLGGYAHGAPNATLVEEYDPANDTWRQRAPLLTGANHIAAIGFDSKLYVFGGFVKQNNDATPAAAVYDPATDRWSAIAPLPQPLGSMSATVLDGKIHLAGGAGGTNNENRHTIAVHYVYDPAANSYSEATPLPFPREHFNLLTLDGKLYAVGGRMENFSQNLATIFVLDPREQQPRWKALPLMPTARSGTQGAVYKGKIFIFGGERFGGVFNTSEMYDPELNRWSTLTAMPVGRHGTGAAVVGDQIFIPAGGPLNGGAAQTNANQAFTYP